MNINLHNSNKWKQSKNSSPVYRSLIKKLKKHQLLSNQTSSLINFQATTIHYHFALKYHSKSHAPVKRQIYSLTEGRFLVGKIRSSFSLFSNIVCYPCNFSVWIFSLLAFLLFVLKNISNQKQNPQKYRKQQLIWILHYPFTMFCLSLFSFENWFLVAY